MIDHIKKPGNDFEGIDIIPIIKILWKNKFLILIFSILGFVFALVYVKKAPEFYTTRVILKQPPIQIFEPYNFAFAEVSFNLEKKLYDQYLDHLNVNIKSRDNFDRFLLEKKYVNEIDESANFIVKLKLIKGNEIELNFPKGKNGPEILNEFIFYSKKVATEEFANNLKLSINNIIKQYQNGYDIASEISLESPILKSMIQGNSVVNEPEPLFYKGTRVLNQKIIHFRNLLKTLEETKLDYNPILDKASNRSTNPVIKNFHSLYPIFGLIIGFTLSILIIFTRLATRKKSFF
ncbi:Wzz/FepE/Etk N-terminal domain-containing protein [Candidatus Pelagibacter sp.]|nr:Wzz/FepE/Etk N-terminal domain-containing protein [Candidatus Pelagibacter sp.]